MEPFDSRFQFTRADSEGIAKRLQAEKKSEEMLAEEIRHRTKMSVCGLSGCSSSENLKKCAKCQIRAYCCREHQQADWTDHKKYCRPPVPDEVKELERPENYDKFPLGNKGRAALAMKYAERLAQALETDFHPAANEEKVYGVEMTSRSCKFYYIGIDFPLGYLVYCTWSFLWKCFHDEAGECFITTNQFKPVVMKFKQDVAQALLAGDLPNWFRQNTLRFREKEHDMYMEELYRRDFRGIKWDYKIHSLCKIWPDAANPAPNTDPYYWLSRPDADFPTVSSESKDHDTSFGVSVWMDEGYGSVRSNDQKPLDITILRRLAQRFLRQKKNTPTIRGYIPDKLVPGIRTHSGSGHCIETFDGMCWVSADGKRREDSIWPVECTDDS